MNKKKKQRILMSKIKETVENEIMEELIDILQFWIKERVYNRPQEPVYYERTGQLYNAVDLKVFENTDNSISFSLFINVDLLQPVKRDGLDAYAAESGQYILSKIPRMVNRGSNLPDGIEAPRFFEHSRTQIIETSVIENILMERLKDLGWEIEVS